MRASQILLSCSLVAAAAVPVHAQDAQSVRLGEAALSYAAVSIRQDMPIEGVINVITGDNQLSGNRMMMGWTGTDTLYLKLKNPGDAMLGELYTVYRRSRKVFHPITKQYMGYIVNRVGVVKVVQLDPLLVGVQVVQSYGPLSPGDPVMRFTPPSTEAILEAVSAGGDVQAMIVELQADKNMSLVSQGNLVYLDKGQSEGVRVGDYMEVFRTGGGLPERKIGEVKILSTEPHTATALLSKATARALIGDRLRSRHASPLDAMQSGAVDMDLPAATVQPVIVPKTDRAASPAIDSRAMNKIRIERAPGGIKVNLDDLVDQLEYESGEVKVKPAALPILEQLTDYLKTAAASQQVRVEGHSDNMEIGPSLKGSFPTNWELSKARAAEIVRYLVEKGGLDSARLSAVGYGSSRPVSSNGSEEGRKKNRRIEVVLDSADEGPQPEPVKAPVSENGPSPAQFTHNQVGFESTASAVVPSPVAIPSGSGPLDATTEHAAVPQDVPAPVAPGGSEAPAPMPGS